MALQKEIFQIYDDSCRLLPDRDTVCSDRQRRLLLVPLLRSCVRGRRGGIVGQQQGKRVTHELKALTTCMYAMH